MGTILIILGVIIAVVFLTGIYSIFAISSQQSRYEEEREWRVNRERN